MAFWRSTRRDLRRYRALSRSARRTLLLAWLLVPLTAASLRIFGFRRIHAVLERVLPVTGGVARAPRRAAARAAAVARLVRAAARRAPVGGGCLPTSIVAWALLRASRISAELRFGVRRGSGTLEAHAWLEYRGAVLDDSPGSPSVFTPIPTLLRALRGAGS
jgi:hypothetical protein